MLICGVTGRLGVVMFKMPPEFCVDNVDIIFNINHMVTCVSKFTLASKRNENGGCDEEKEANKAHARHFTAPCFSFFMVFLAFS